VKRHYVTHDDTERQQYEWIISLLSEAERDLVFLWNITTGSFGRRKYAEDELPAVVARIAGALIESGCKVGCGDPDGSDWEPATNVLSGGNPGVEINARWGIAPGDYEFLVFAKRLKTS
jgi:hypothetical protein